MNWHVRTDVQDMHLGIGKIFKKPHVQISVLGTQTKYATTYTKQLDSLANFKNDSFFPLQNTNMEKNNGDDL